MMISENEGGTILEQVVELSPKVVQFLEGNKKMFINGEWVESISGKTFATINPATGEVLANVYEADVEDVDRAVHAAREAFDHGQWTKMNASDRSRLIYKLADLIEDNREELAQIDTLDNGKPIRETRRVDVPAAIEHLRYYAGWSTKIVGQTIPVRGQFFNYTKHEPVGVVGQIIPWNVPLLMATWKLGAALATGCTVVLKPAEQTPLSALYLAKLIEEAGFPKGVVNIVQGYGPTTGEALITHEKVNKVAFTGSTTVGKHIMRKAADTLKRVTLELGGKSPNIIFPDANLPNAIRGALMGITYNQGEVCSAGSRLFVHKKVYDNVLADLATYANDIRLGPGLNERTQMGPLVSEEQQSRVLNYIQKGQEEGAEIITGGNNPFDQGYFVKPTVFSAVDDHSTIAKEEIFGPVVAAMPFDDLDEVIERANNTTYGLAAGVW